MAPAATGHRQWWYATDECFLFSVDSTLVVFFTTLSLSQNTCVGSPRGSGTPKHRSLKRRCSMASRHALSAINSAENVLVSTLCCLLLYHTTGARLRNTTYPECDRLVTLFAACDASTNAVVVTVCPLVTGIQCGSNSSASRYISEKSSLLVRKSP